MRVAFFSPLPPARSGIADYSEALVESLRPLVDLEIFSDSGRAFDAARFDVALYHVGNNAFHDFVYETALRHPGVVVMHESNLSAHLPVRALTLHRDGGCVDAVRVRSHGRRIQCRIERELAAGRHAHASIALAEPAERTAPGQIACLYAGELVVGHATVES